jgi:hypothetical protein
MASSVIVLLIAALFTSVPVAFAQQRHQTLATNERGTIAVEGNEILADSKILDAAAVRVGAPRGLSSGGGGKFSYDVLLPDGSRREIALTTAGEGVNGPEWGLTILKKEGGTRDEDQTRVIEATAEGVHFHVPISAPNLGVTRDRITSADGRFSTFIQNDGNLVTYEVVGLTWCPRWSSWHGVIPKSALPEPCN